MKADQFFLVTLHNLLEVLGEDATKDILSEFSCPKNKDVETFIRQKAIMFSKQGVAETHLVFTKINGERKLIGYFSLAMKTFTVKLQNIQINHKMRSRMKRFLRYDNEAKKHVMSALLIGQLGKNYVENCDQLITGEELLELACQKAKQAQAIVAGRFIYLECEDKPKLRRFYERNGFECFGQRSLDRDEGGLAGDYLLQYIKYIK